MSRAGVDATTRRRPLLTAAACLLLATGLLLGFLALTRPGTPEPAAAWQPPPAVVEPVVSAPTLASRPVAGVPVRLVVPPLDVDTAVEPIAAAGAVLTPPGDPRRVGWWRDGARPGDGLGSILVTGHTVHTGGGAFDHLGRLRPGDRVDVGTAHGWRHYRVTQTLFLTTGQLAARSAALFAQDGPERLVLVTCAAWDGAEYAGSTVVLADPV